MSYQSPPYAGNASLTPEEVRVLGCLLEKQRTTPDVYPLSLNSLRLACNQATNREPVVDYDESTIRDALARLERRGYTRLASGAGSRTAKYRHLLADALPMERSQQAIVCVLMLRGAQTPGELKQRTERMHAFDDLAEVLETLERLIARGLVARLERRPGHKEERYAQLLGAAEDRAAQERAQPPSQADAATGGERELRAPGGGEPDTSELRELRARVERLERELDELREQMRHPVGQQQP